MGKITARPFLCCWYHLWLSPLAVNITRRHLSKGQQAMILVKASLLDSSKTSQQATAEENGLSQQRLSQASTVQSYGPELVEDVVSGMTSLAVAGGRAPVLS